MTDINDFIDQGAGGSNPYATPIRSLLDHLDVTMVGQDFTLSVPFE